MSHDITRDSYLIHKQTKKQKYAKVRRLQGRIFTDADFNEQVDLEDRRVRDFLTDLIGHHAGTIVTKATTANGGSPEVVSFDVSSIDENQMFVDLKIGKGVYYVDGIRITNHKENLTYTSQFPSDVGVKLPEKPAQTLAAGTQPPANQPPATGPTLLVFLVVQNVPVTPLDDPALLDPGFEGRDSCNRDKWDWLVRVAYLADQPTKLATVEEANFANRKVGPRDESFFGKLAFQVDSEDTDECVVSMDANTFTGLSNQLYRFEIHESGTVPGDTSDKVTPRMKWSRDNGAVAFAIVANQAWSVGQADQTGTWTIALESLDALGGLRTLEPLHWVEPRLPDWYHRDLRFPLLWVESVDPDNRSVTVSLGRGRPMPQPGALPNDPLVLAVQALKILIDFKTSDVAKPRLILWDHQGGDCHGIAFGNDNDKVKIKDDTYLRLRLEHGLSALLLTAKYFRAGDYWLYPARPSSSPLVTGPRLADGPEQVYAPLALFQDLKRVADLRMKFASISIES